MKNDKDWEALEAVAIAQATYLIRTRLADVRRQYPTARPILTSTHVHLDLDVRALK